MNWFDYKQFEFYRDMEELRDIVISEYHSNKETVDQTKVGLSVKERYGTTADDINWFGFPLIDVEVENKEYSQYWPRTTEKLKSIPGIINSCINYVGPNSRIPDHVDMDIEESVIGKRMAIGTIIGIDMPSSDPSVIGFHVNDEIKGWGTGEIVCINGCKNHGGWNKSRGWRVTLLFDTDQKYWELS